MKQADNPINNLKNKNNFKDWWEGDGERTCLRKADAQLVLDGLPLPQGRNGGIVTQKDSLEKELLVPEKPLASTSQRNKNSALQYDNFVNERNSHHSA